MKIYAIRHGLTELNKRGILNGRLDESLAPEGIEQAELAAQSIPASITHIYTSSLTRAKQTAEIINKKVFLPVTFHDELREVHFGKLTGMSWETIESGEELKSKHRSVQYDYSPEGESADAVKNRVSLFLREISKNHTDGEILIVTHGGIIRVLQKIVNNKPDDKIENAFLFTFDISKILT